MTDPRCTVLLLLLSESRSPLLTSADSWRPRKIGARRWRLVRLRRHPDFWEAKQRLRITQ